MKKLVTLLAVCASTLLLTACGGPSDSAVEDTVRATLVKAGAEVHSVKSLGCAEAQGSNGFVCDVQTDVSFTMPLIGVQRKQSTGKVRLVKADGKWNLVDNR